MKLRQKGWQGVAGPALLVLALLLAGRAEPQVTAPAELAPFPVLAADGEPLRTAFNRNADKVRLLLLLDPT
ncbi:MAG: hypothetical protein ACRD35_07120 [Candidatus Acidiferrales bacterium]